MKSCEWDWNRGSVFAELAFWTGFHGWYHASHTTCSTPCCSLPPTSYPPSGSSVIVVKGGHLHLPEPTECPLGLDLHHLSLLTSFPFTFSVTFLSFPLDPNRHLSQALVVSLHAAANNPPSATIPTVGSSFLWRMEVVWETSVPSTKPPSWTQPYPLPPRPSPCKPGETQQGPNGWSM